MRSIPSNGLKVPTRALQSPTSLKGRAAGRQLPQNTHGCARECQRGRRATTTPNDRWRSGVHRCRRSPLPIIQRGGQGNRPPQSPLRGERQPAQFVCHGGNKNRARFSCDGVPKLICERCTRCRWHYRSDAGHTLDGDLPLTLSGVRQPARQILPPYDRSSRLAIGSAVAIHLTRTLPLRSASGGATLSKLPS
jgi:hypothetical protein